MIEVRGKMAVWVSSLKPYLAQVNDVFPRVCLMPCLPDIESTRFLNPQQYPRSRSVPIHLSYIPAFFSNFNVLLEI